MHDIEPHFKWRDQYVAAQDERSPFYGRVYDEFTFTQKIYNYFIHPQWDHFGSDTLYLKILFIDYSNGFAIIELLGEWNDCLSNDVMFLKREIIDQLTQQDIFKFVLIGENVLNFHGSDDCYYEEWYEDIVEEGGWICLLNFQEHVLQEMKETQLQFFLNFGERFNAINWRSRKPAALCKIVEQLIHGEVKRLSY
ncbi:MAG: hypothetical protein AAGD05_04650 [Bacteroidota bacterium]